MSEIEQLRAENAQLKAACAEMRHVIDAITSDPHNWSMRPCVTCRRASEVMGHLVGCYEFHAQHGKTLEEVKFKVQVGKGWVSPERRQKAIDLLRSGIKDCDTWSGMTLRVELALATLEEK